MNELKIAKELSLPLDAVTQKLAWLGRTGSGKTYGAKRMVEQMLRAGAQVVVLDPVGVWAGLRLGPKALDVAVLGGLFADVPLESTAGALVADLVVDTGLSFVLDVSQMRDAERTRFATAFAERFFQRKKAVPSAVHVVLEECQEFVPQNPQPGEQRMLHEFQHLAKLGRNFGIGLSLITQRPQEVAKKALNQSECIFAFQLTGPQERKALEYWLSDKGLGEKLGDLLPKLKVGAPHVWSPQWLEISKVVHILPIDTQDTSQTPQVGAKAGEQRKLKAIDLPALKEAMAAAIERDEQENPERLRARIAELEQQLTEEQSESKVHFEPVEVIKEVPCVDVGLLHRLRDEVQAEVGRVFQHAVHAAGVRNAEALGPTVEKPRGMLPQPRSNANFPGAATERRPAPPAPPAGTDEGPLPKVERLILTALAQHQGRELTRQRLALLVGYHANSKSFANALGALRGRGAIDGLGITDKGLKQLGRYDRLPTGPALLEWYCANKLSGVEARIAHAVRDGRGKLGREDIARKLDYHPNAKSFANGLGRLRGLGILDGLQLAAGLS